MIATDYLTNDVATKRDGLPTLLPFYLIADVSGSMAKEIAALNQALVDFRDELNKNPILSDVVRFSVISFSDSTRVELPFCDPVETTMPTLVVGGGTRYAPAFRTLKATIDADFDANKGKDFKVFRPAAFFLTDGMPLDPESEWQSAFADLVRYDSESKTGNKRYPLFVPFGFRDANVEILKQLVHPLDRSKLYMAKHGASAGSVLAELSKAMIMSVVSSGYSVPTGNPQHVLPTQAQVGPNVTAYDGGDLPDED